MSYANAIATAKRVLGRKGKLITITRKGQGTIDEIAGNRASGGDKSGTFYTVGLPAAGRSAELQLGTLVGRKLQMFYMARVNSQIDPEPGDIIPWLGKNWNVVWAGTFDPDASGKSIFTQAYGEIA